MPDDRSPITFTTGDRAFNLRAVAVIVHNGRALLHRAVVDDFWALPGGRVELGEAAADTLRREMREEIGEEVEVGRLLWLVENFFEYMGKRWHEIAFYFEVRLPPGCPLYEATEPFSGMEDFYPEGSGGIELIFQWHSVDGLESVYLLPSFLRTGLRSLPEQTQYIVHEDERIS
ncbi:MAG TPA: NUDIX domain-containing protein [Chloroflexia bacterium]|nr:NUDIX domain-containing protein [Chloroflexia bacterium]